MKREIFLQVGPDCTIQDRDQVSWCEVTWSFERIYETDIMFVVPSLKLADALDLIQELGRGASASLTDDQIQCDPPHPDHQRLADWVMSKCQNFLEGESK